VSPLNTGKHLSGVPCAGKSLHAQCRLRRAKARGLHSKTRTCSKASYYVWHGWRPIPYPLSTSRPSSAGPTQLYDERAFPNSLVGAQAVEISSYIPEHSCKMHRHCFKGSSARHSMRTFRRSGTPQSAPERLLAVDVSEENKVEAFFFWRGSKGLSAATTPGIDQRSNDLSSEPWWTTCVKAKRRGAYLRHGQLLALFADLHKLALISVRYCLYGEQGTLSGVLSAVGPMADCSSACQ
jgi:hypothetical protein